MSVVMTSPRTDSRSTDSPRGEAVTVAVAAGQPGQVLVAADDTSIQDVRDLVAQLDAVQTLTCRTRGQIFIEVATASQIEHIETPELVTVTWLTRDSRTGEPGTSTSCAPGQALGRSVRAWVSEMSTGDADFDGGEITAVVFGRELAVSDLRLDLITRLGIQQAESAAV
jgi:NADPH-dependent ferric siderophore reductase